MEEGQNSAGGDEGKIDLSDRLSHEMEEGKSFKYFAKSFLKA